MATPKRFNWEKTRLRKDPIEKRPDWEKTRLRKDKIEKRPDWEKTRLRKDPIEKPGDWVTQGKSWFLNDLWSSLLKHVYYCNQGDERAWPGLYIFENTAYILSNHKYQCYQMVTCESDCFLQSLRGELTQENERRRLPLDVLLAWGCITLLGSSASAIIGAITLYDNSLFWPPGFDHPDCPALLL